MVLHSQRRQWFSKPYLLILPALLLLLFFFLLPYGNLLIVSFRTPSAIKAYEEDWTVANYVKAFTDPYYLSVLWDTLVFGFVTTFLCLLLGYPVAYHLARTTSRWKGVFYTFILSPLLVGVVIRCYGWMVLLSDHGLINNILMTLGIVHTPLKLMYNAFGVYVGLVHVFLPFLILPLFGTLQGIDPTLETAARSLGASKLHTFSRITLPLSVPGIISGTVLVFVLTISAYVIPILLGGFKVMIIPTLVVQQVLEASLWPFGAALASLLFVVAALLIFCYVKGLSQLMKGVMDT